MFITHHYVCLLMYVLSEENPPSEYNHAIFVSGNFIRQSVVKNHPTEYIYSQDTRVFLMMTIADCSICNLFYACKWDSTPAVLSIFSAVMRGGGGLKGQCMKNKKIVPGRQKKKERKCVEPTTDRGRAHHWQVMVWYMAEERFKPVQPLGLGINSTHTCII